MLEIQLLDNYNLIGKELDCELWEFFIFFAF